MTRLIALFSMLLISTLSFAQSGSQVVATVGNKKITLDEFNKKYAELTSQVLVNPPAKKTFLEDLVRYEVGQARQKIF